ncbi:CPBP family intramembrane metalloprotease [Nonomuraea terrae]|uniref:CPBP family intramembrane metalloprotease n=1 Tax=Nonomuraea terrae TaxID=2530383 RepID=A0A4V2YIX0_9ACTN|nr:CPBP family intramembrane metalloprotease [Nonomuraea terrae]
MARDPGWWRRLRGVLRPRGRAAATYRKRCRGRCRGACRIGCDGPHRLRGRRAHPHPRALGLRCPPCDAAPLRGRRGARPGRLRARPDRRGRLHARERRHAERADGLPGGRRGRLVVARPRARRGSDHHPTRREGFFRGVLANTLFARYQAWIAVVVSAAVFAVAHGINPILPVAFVVGVLAVLLFRWSGSIWSGVVLHGVNNATALLASPFFALAGA